MVHAACRHQQPLMVVYGSDGWGAISNASRVGLEDAPRHIEAASNISKFHGMLGLGRGSMFPVVVRWGRSDDARSLFALPVRPLLPLTFLWTTLKTFLLGEAATSPTTGSSMSRTAS